MARKQITIYVGRNGKGQMRDHIVMPRKNDPLPLGWKVIKNQVKPISDKFMYPCTFLDEKLGNDPWKSYKDKWTLAIDGTTDMVVTAYSKTIQRRLFSTSAKFPKSSIGETSPNSFFWEDRVGSLWVHTILKKERKHHLGIRTEVPQKFGLEDEDSHF